jgi:endo-1,4-beta-xylanase
VYEKLMKGNKKRRKMKRIVFALWLGLAVSGASAQDSLRYWADKLDRYVGSSVEGYFFENDFWLMTNKTYHKILKGQFNMIVAGNEMKPDATEPQRNVFSFTKGDILVEYAETYDMAVRGHCLLWHQQLPAWINAGLTDGVDNGLYSRDTLLSILENHITTLVTHWKGKVREWDVVNEVFEGDGSLRESIWKQVIGDDYIDSAFVWAHRADPDALLFILEYGAEAINSKSDGLYAKCQELIGKGIPIHGVGMQCHFTKGDINFFSVEQYMKRLTNLGLLVSITELDIRIPVEEFSTGSALQAQAEEYGQLMSLFLDCESCPSFVVWAFSDADSWIPAHTNGTHGQACIYNAKYEPKPAYYAILDTLKARNGVSVLSQSITKNPFSIVPTLVDDHLTVVSETGSQDFETAVITSMEGKQVAHLQGIKSGEIIPVPPMERGMYVLTLFDPSGRLYMYKFIKQ